MGEGEGGRARWVFVGCMVFEDWATGKGYISNRKWGTSHIKRERRLDEVV